MERNTAIVASSWRPPSPVGLNRAQRKLAELIGKQWRDEAELWQVTDPDPLPVWWRFTDRDVMDRPEVVAGIGCRAWCASFAGGAVQMRSAGWWRISPHCRGVEWWCWAIRARASQRR